MSVKWITWAWERAVPPSTKLTLIALADHAGEDGTAWPGTGRLCAKTGHSDRTVRRHLDLMEELGMLTRVRRRRQDGTLGTYTYQLQEQPAVRLTGGQPPVTSDHNHRSPVTEPPVTHDRAESSEEPSEEPSDKPAVAFAPAASLDRRRIGREIAQSWYDRVKAEKGRPPTAPSFMAVAKMAEKALAVYEQDEITEAFVTLYGRGRVITGQSLDELLSGRARTGYQSQREKTVSALDELARDIDVMKILEAGK